VTARATDTGGGVASFALEVDGKAVASAGAPGCQAAPYTSPTPCPADVSQMLALDTNTLAYGKQARREVGDQVDVLAAVAPRAPDPHDPPRKGAQADDALPRRRRGRPLRLLRLGQPALSVRLGPGRTANGRPRGGQRRRCAIRSRRFARADHRHRDGVAGARCRSCG